jgi:hypothetical protein
MFRKLQVAVVLFCMFSYAAAGTVSIGTASARGDMRVDNYSVKGNATIFDGSVVETGQATADLRLNKGTEITMSTSSRGTLYSDHLVLQQGESELAANSSFQLEANGFRVTAREPNSRAVVSLKAGNTVEVAALNGSFGVTNGHGVLLASVRPGRVVSFAMQAGGKDASFSTQGLVSYENGHYYLASVDNMRYELTGKDFKRFVGDKVVISGTMLASSTPTADVAGVISVSSLAINGPDAGTGTLKSWIIVGSVAAVGVGIGLGVYESNQASSPASR